MNLPVKLRNKLLNIPSDTYYQSTFPLNDLLDLKWVVLPAISYLLVVTKIEMYK